MDNNVYEKTTVIVLFFAKSRELSGFNETTLSVNSKIICGDLLQLICSTYNLGPIKNNLILALNQVYQKDMKLLLTLKENDEIAIIPPISGG